MRSARRRSQRTTKRLDFVMSGEDAADELVGVEHWTRDVGIFDGEGFQVEDFGEGWIALDSGEWGALEVGFCEFGFDQELA
jgi:hypothetical protein